MRLTPVEKTGQDCANASGYQNEYDCLYRIAFYQVKDITEITDK